MVKLKELTTLKKLFLAEAKKLGLTDDFLFVSRFNEYCNMLSRLKDLNRILDEEGYNEVIPVGRDGEKTVTHHLYADYLKTDANAQKIAAYLRDTIEKAERNRVPDEEDDL